MTNDRLLRRLASRNPVRWGGIEGFRLTRRTLLASAAAAAAVGDLGRDASAQQRPLNLLTWDAYADPRLNELWQAQTQDTLKPEIHISDPQSVNRLRAGETKNFDFLNVNDPWARPYLWPEKLIVDLPRERFEPLFMQMKDKFKPPFKRCYSEDGQHLLGVVQRFETFDFAINTDKISVDTAEKEGWSLFSNPDFAQRYGILAYDDWNVIDICMGAGVHPFKDKSEADIAKFTETANLWVKNAKMITTDFVQLNLGLLNGDIDLYFHRRHLFARRRACRRQQQPLCHHAAQRPGRRQGRGELDRAQLGDQQPRSAPAHLRLPRSSSPRQRPPTSWALATATCSR